MNRRNFCHTLIATASSLAVGASFGAHAAATNGSAVSVFDAFEAERQYQPWTLGYAGLQADVPPMPLRMQGRLPSGLAGAFYRNGAARHQLGGQRYHHWFDGDGMVQKYTLSERGVSHQGKFVRTPKFLADSEAGQPVRAGFGTHTAGMQAVTSADAINVANTSVVHHAGELMALWEGGSATVVDAGTLETKGVKTWSPDYAGMPFSAHPRIEPNGTLWNFGVSSLQSVLSIYRVNADGSLHTATSMKVRDLGMVHDFAITAQHLVFLIPPLVFEAERMRSGLSFLDSHVWKPNLGMRVMVLHKDKLDAPLWFDLPVGFVFHLGNAWEAQGMIRLDYLRTPSAHNATHFFKDLMRGQNAEQEAPRVATVELNLSNGQAHQQLFSPVAEFPRVDPRHIGRRHQQLFLAERVGTPQHPGFNAVLRLDVSTGQTDRYQYGASTMAEEHVFVPRQPGNGREGDGWVIGTALDYQRREMLFSVFKANRLADGPVAQGRMARAMPLGLHGSFVAA